MRARVSKLGILSAFAGLVSFGLLSGCADDGEGNDGNDGACQLELDADGTRTLICGDERVPLAPTCEDGFPRDVMLSPPITELVADGVAPAEAFSPFVPYEVFELTGCTAINGGFIVLKTMGEQLPASVARLRHVSGAVAIQNNPNLTSLKGLENLETMGALVLAGNPLLTELAAFENVSAFSDERDDSLGLAVVDNAALVNLTGLEGVESIGGRVLITGNISLSDLSALDGVQSVGGGMEISRNDALEQFDAFNALTSLGINENDVSIQISSNDRLETIGGFDALETAGGEILIHDNERLTSVSSFEKLVSTGGEISFTNNDALTTISGFNVLKTVPGRLSISSLPRLASIHGFDALSNDETNLQIMSNPLLTTIKGFSATRELGALWIVENPKLTELDGFSLLSRVWGNLSVYDNVLFSQCTATDRFGTVAVDGSRVTSPNGPCP